MINKIYSKEWGYDRTIVDFYKIVKETEHFVTFQPLKKKQTGQNHEVVAIEEKDGDTFRVKKSKMWRFDFWDGSPIKENHNYTYTGL